MKERGKKIPNKIKKVYIFLLKEPIYRYLKWNGINTFLVFLKKYLIKLANLITVVFSNINRHFALFHRRATAIAALAAAARFALKNMPRDILKPPCLFIFNYFIVCRHRPVLELP